MAPDKIFLQVCGSCDLEETCENCEFAKLLDGGEVTWSEDRIYEKDEEYIRKDALLDFIKEKGNAVRECNATEERKVAALSVIDFLTDKIKSL